MSYNKETGMCEGFIYKIYNDVNDKIYIGQTTRTIEQRWAVHLAKSKTNKPEMAISKAIKKYGYNVFHIEKIYELICETKEALLQCLNREERHYIIIFNSKTPNGYNLTSGGDSLGEFNQVPIKQYLFNGVLLKEWDSIISASNFYNISPGLITDCCKGKINFCNGYVWRYKDEPFDLYHLSEEAITKALSIYKIKQFDFLGNCINIYHREELLQKYGISGYHNIIKACKGSKKYYNMSIWKYEFDTFNTSDIIISQKKEKIKSNKVLDGNRNEKGQIKPKFVNCYDMNNKYIKTYNSIQDAGSAVGLKNAYNITLVCTGKRNHAKGFKWYYANDKFQPDKTKIIT